MTQAPNNALHSFIRVLIGIFLATGAFAILYWNEGHKNEYLLAKQSVSAKADTVDAEREGAFVSVTGAVKSSERLGDEGFLVNRERFIKLARVVEVFVPPPSSVTDASGVWTNVDTEGYARHIDEKTFVVKNATLGAYEIAPSLLDLSLTPLPLSEAGVVTYATQVVVTQTVTEVTQGGENGQDEDALVGDEPRARATDEPRAVEGDEAANTGDASTTQLNDTPKEGSGTNERTVETRRVIRDIEKTLVTKATQRYDEGYIYIGMTSIEDAAFGDRRVSYRVAKQDERYTAFGVIKETRLTPYEYGKSATFYAARKGDRGAALSALATPLRTRMILRIVGIVLLVGACFVLFPEGSALLLSLPKVRLLASFGGNVLIGVIHFFLALLYAGAYLLALFLVYHPGVFIAFAGVTLILTIIGAVFAKRKQAKGHPAPVRE